MTQETTRKLIEWATGDDTGVSSEGIVRFMMGFPPNKWNLMAPGDDADRGRCIRLLDLVPGWRARLPEMKKISHEWEYQIEMMLLARKVKRGEV